MSLRNVSILSILAGAVLLVAVVANAAPPDTDEDGVPNNRDNCPQIPNLDQDDGDNDRVGDLCDNCTLVGNAGQEDADNDGFGNRCDGDLNGDLAVTIADWLLVAPCITLPGQGVKPECEASDFNSDNRVNSLDFQIFEELLVLLVPGPSAFVF
jgi:hypothetical protein